MGDVHDVETVRDSPEARFGAALRRVRVQAGVSVRRLAKDLDRAHSTISDFENGRRLAGVEVVEEYEDYFGLARGTLGAQRERARAELLEAPRDATLDENLGDVVCPYMGLRAFEYDDAALFFGRETQVRDVLARLKETRFVAVLGPSGSGKSSFVRAGLLAGINTAATNGRPSARVVLLTPGEHPLTTIATAVATSSAPVTPDELRGDPDRLGRAARDAGDGAVVLVVDQLEELFTLCADEPERRCFVEALIAAWREPRVVVIVALRADFYGRVAAYPELAAAVVTHQALIGPMSPAELRRAIELPAAGCGLLLQPGLADTILGDLEGEPGALPLLSHALLETWKLRSRLMLSVGAYREAGGVRGAIAQTAERTLVSLSEADQQIARSIFLTLTDIGEHAEPTRRRVDLADLALRVDPTERDRVLAVLVDARLVTLDETTVTVAHEALIRHWPRLRGWIETDRAGLLTHRRLTAAARDWDNLHREPAALLRGARLATATEWAADHADDLSQLERGFLACGLVLEHNDLQVARRRTRRLRSLATGIAMLAVVVAALAVWALDQRASSQRRASEATSLALATSSLALRNDRPDVALLLALEANRAIPRVEARSSAIAALVAARDPGVVAILHGHTGGVSDLALSPDERTLASVDSFADTVRFWDARTHKQLGPTQIAYERIVGVAFGAGGRTVMSAAVSGTLRSWDVRAGKPVGHPLISRPHGFESVAFSGDGRTMAAASGDRILLWDLRRRRRIGTPMIDTGLVRTLAFSRDGRTLASAGENPAVRLWDVRHRRRLGAPLTGHTSSVTSVVFSPDGRTLASGSIDRTIRLWDIGSRKAAALPLAGHTGEVTSVAFSANGRTLASGSADGTIRLWDVHSRRQLGIPLIGHTRRISSVVFSRDGHTLWSASADSTMRVWDLRAHGRVVVPPNRHTDGVTSVAFSPDGRTLASGSADKTIRLWDLHTHAPKRALLTGHTSRVTSVAFSPNGRMLASAGGDKLRLWDMRSRHELVYPFVIGENSESVAFDQGGRTLAISGRPAEMWELPISVGRTGTPLPFEPSDRVTTVAFSPDGRTLAAGSSDKTIELWDVATGTRLGVPLTGHTRRAFSVAFSPDGRTLASGGDDTTIRFWEKILWRNFPELETEVCNFVGSGLSATEWRQYADSIPYHQSCR